MGLVEQGVVRGLIPEDKLFAVNYPGYPSTVERAVETLGGLEGIAKARESESNFLELRFRAQDPCAHPAFGELSKSSNLLLRFSRGSARQDEVRAEVVGRVEQQYVFDGMADYQYLLAVHAEAGKSRKSRKVDPARGKKGEEDEEMMMLVPCLFSLKDMPDEIVLRPVEYTRLRKVVPQAAQAPSVLVDDSGPVMKCFGLDFKCKDIPPQVNWKEKLEKGSDDYLMQSAVDSLFEERPVWAKLTLQDKLQEQGMVLTSSQLKRLLFRTAYNFGYGPFRNLWVRNGYDPRLDPQSRMYQMLDYRVPRVVRNPTGQQPQPLRGQKEMYTCWKDICRFKVAPTKKFSFLQLYDLEDDFIQAEIRKPAERTGCSEYTGWFRRWSLERIRQHARVRFLALTPGDAARALEAAEMKNLQRAKSPSDPRGEDDDDDDVVQRAPRMPQLRRSAGKYLLNPSSFHPDSTLVDHPPCTDFGVIQAGFGLPEGRLTQSDSAMPLEETEYNEEDEDDLKEDEEEEEDDEEDEEDDDNLDEEEVEEEEGLGAGRAKHMLSQGIMPNGYLQELLGKFSGNAQETPPLGDDAEEYAIYDEDYENEDGD